MMVCFVSPYSPRNISGISVLLARMAERLEEKGHEPLLIAPMSFTSSKKPIFFRPEKNLFEIEIKTGLLKNLYLAIATILRILKLRRRIDIIHLHQPHMQCFLSAVMGRAIGKPVIVTYHLKLARAAGGLKYAQQTVLEKLVAKFSNKLIYVSERTRDEYNLSGIVIRNGVDIDRFNSDVRTKVEARNRFGIGAKYFAILFAGRWTEDKGIFEVLESVSKLKKRHNDWKLLLVGGGDESNTNKVCNAIERLGIGNNVIKFGFVEDSLLKYIYCASDIFLLPSHLEGLPIALLEAMGCGVTPVVTDVGGNAEVVDNGSNGLIVPPRDTARLAARIEWLIDNPEELARMGRNASKTIANKFNIERTTSAYIDVYQSLINRAR